MKIPGNILYKGILILGILFLFFKQYFFGFMLLLTFPFAWFFTKAVDKTKINRNYSILIYVALWLHLIGEFYLYANLPYYDKLLHFFVPMLITSMVYDYTKKFKFEYKNIGVFLAVVGMLCLFEIFEFGIDLFLGLDMIGVINMGEIIISPLSDTMSDLIFGTLGSLLFLVIREKNKK